MILKPNLPPLQITAPASEPVALTDAKPYLRVDINDDDVMIAGMVAAARQRAEAFTQRSLITQTWQLYFDYAHDQYMGSRMWDRDSDYDVIRLMFPPIQAVTAFEYLSAASTWTAVDPSLWHYDSGGQRIVLDGLLPTPALFRSSYRVTYTAGYGGTGDAVPQAIKYGILALALHFYENREAYSAAPMTAMPAAGENLLAPYKVMAY